MANKLFDFFIKVHWLLYILIFFFYFRNLLCFLNLNLFIISKLFS